jgi:SAM-dependent methyltransferase
MPIKHREFWNFYWTQWIREHPELLMPQSEAKREVPEQVEPYFSPLLRREHWVGKRVIEAGCGVSRLALYYAHQAARYVGLDISELVVLLMRTLVPERAVFYLLEDLYDRRVVRRERGADTFFAGYVFIHLGWDEAVPMMRMARDLVKPGGALIATFYREVDRRYGPSEADHPTPGNDTLVCYAEEQLQRLLEVARFEVTERKEFAYEGNLAVNLIAARR